MKEGRKEGRKGGMEGGMEAGTDEGTGGGREAGREAGREVGIDGGREGGTEGGMNGWVFSRSCVQGQATAHRRMMCNGYVTSSASTRIMEGSRITFIAPYSVSGVSFSANSGKCCCSFGNK